jgi:malate dehydrogenase
VAVASDGSYGVEKGLICSFPIRSNGTTSTIVQGVELGEFGKAKFQQTVNELLEEKAMVSELLPN